MVVTSAGVRVVKLLCHLHRERNKLETLGATETHRFYNYKVEIGINVSFKTNMTTCSYNGSKYLSKL